MVVEKNVFDVMANSIITTLTYIMHAGSGILQVSIYFLMVITFGFALVKTYQTFRALVCCDLNEIAENGPPYDFFTNTKTPLSVIAASFFEKSKGHYLEEKKNGQTSEITIPPDAFIRDAAFQFSERYFERTFLEPISMIANLMPPLGFIGTIMGMVIHFLSNTGSLTGEITMGGIATALYTTFIGLICYTFLEFLKKTFCTLAHKRIDEGLSAVSASTN
ncbi:MAG: MotA/TolQ/ExbB proton channel family protein [Deltaproteobacteria bacterium]|nr:MotA/TolQ/ExbB proton channel family protein [Deltaproteobacteria bacterium]